MTLKKNNEFSPFFYIYLTDPTNLILSNLKNAFLFLTRSIYLIKGYQLAIDCILLPYMFQVILVHFMLLPELFCT